MRRRRASGRALSALLALLCSAPLAAEQQAELPYVVLYQQLAIFEELGHLRLVSPQLTITSVSEEVDPSDITITLQTAEETLVFEGDEQGRYDFPFRGEWADAGYVLVANQPAGTLQLNASYVARRLKATRLPYVGLMACAPEFAEALTAQARAMGAPEPRVKGLLIRFPGGGPGSVTIHSSGGDQLYSTDENGYLALPTDAEIWKENPEISLSEQPDQILPWQDASGA